MTFAAHFGIDPGTKQNRNGNVVPPCCAPGPGPRARGCVNEPLTASATRLQARRESGCAAGRFCAYVSSHDASETRKAGAAGNVAVPPGEAFPRDPRL